MPTILFIAALVFAIPTFGLSVLAYIGYLVWRAMSQAKARMAYADEQQAMREASRTAQPGVRRLTCDNADEFAQQMIQAGLRVGTPAAYTTLMMSHPVIGASFKQYMRTIDDGVTSLGDMKQLATAHLQMLYAGLDDRQKRELKEADQAVRSGQIHSIDTALFA